MNPIGILNDFRALHHWSTEELWSHFQKSALGSDHIPIMHTFQCLSDEVICLRAVSCSLADRVAVLVSHKNKRCFGLLIAARTLLECSALIPHWRARSGISHHLRRQWRRIFRHGVDCMVARYWHIRNMGLRCVDIPGSPLCQPPAPKSSKVVSPENQEWDLGFRAAGLDKFCETVRLFARDHRVGT